MTQPGKPLSPDTPVQYIKGIGPKRAEVLEKHDIHTVEDLLYYVPRRYIDRSRMVKIRNLKVGQEVTVVGQVFSLEIARGRRSRRLIVMITDGSGFLQCVWFRGIPYVEKKLQRRDTVAFSGKVTSYRGPQLVHPEYDILAEEGGESLHTGAIIPMYPSTNALTSFGFDSRGFRRVIHHTLFANKIDVQETLSVSLLRELTLMSIAEALHHIHFPKNAPDLKKAEYRLKFEELFFLQLFLNLQRKTRQIEKDGIAFPVVGDLFSKLLDVLLFELTDAQKRVLKEIRADMKSPVPMNRLIQGDVGSGKTIVALLTMMIGIANGYQSVLMAPTEILAEQHFLTIHQMLEPFGIRVGLLSGSLKSKIRKETLENISNGNIQIAIGTHALVQKGVEFANLGLVVIDEQHRFGVLQRAALRRKGKRPDVLVMTATPIPRTLALTLYGDLDVSVIDEKPKHRIPIKTIWYKDHKREMVYAHIRDEIGAGRQAYIVYPLVEESEKLDLAAATEGFELLSKTVFSDFKVGLLHGRIKQDERERIMSEFKEGSVQILVCTTVIEVGVDVPNVTLMLVEHAERFGLTQLHQLRGRIGRGKNASTCYLLSGHALSEEARKRLSTMVETDDGFKIAEADLQIRGPGEICGTRQHGELNLKIANLATDGRILQQARDISTQLVNEDPRLGKTENKVVLNAYLKKYQGKFGLIEVG